MRRVDDLILNANQTTAKVLFNLPNNCTELNITNPVGVTSSATTITSDSIITFTFSTVSAEILDRVTENDDNREIENNTDTRILEGQLTLFAQRIDLEYVYPQTTEENSFNIIQSV